MGLGEKIGRGFLKLAQKGDEIDQGLDDLLGEDRTKAGDGFSSERTAKRTEGIIKSERNSSKLSLGDKKSKDKINTKTPNFYGEKSGKQENDDEEDRRFF